MRIDNVLIGQILIKKPNEHFFKLISDDHIPLGIGKLEQENVDGWEVRANSF